ncbi:hypothetical protein AB3S75_042092 [Citrus x aurantiifolia]
MSVFRIPAGLCDDIQRTVARFWWGSKEDKLGIHWTRWEKLSVAKSRGGLGFRDFTCFNQALVAKQGWRLLQYPNSLVAKVMQARYYKHSEFLHAKAGCNPSFIWRSIL